MNLRAHEDPYVARFLQADPDPESMLRSLREMVGPLPAKLEAIRLLLEITLGLEPPGDHFRRLDSAYHERSSLDRHLLFLITWAHALFFVEPDEPQLQVLRDRILSLLTSETPPEIVAWARVVHAFALSMAGDAVGGLKAVEDLSVGIPSSSPHRARLELIRVFVYLWNGLGSVARATLPPSFDTALVAGRLAMVRLVNTALTGDLDQIETIPTAPAVPNARTLLWPSQYYAHCHTIALLAEAQGRAELLQQARARLQDLPEPAWVTSARYLLRDHREDALRWARVHARQEPLSRPTMVGFDEYTLVRAELAAGNAGAARRLLAGRHTRGTRHYIDDFFLARAELASGNKELSGRHFARVLRAAEEYGAMGRLDFEMRLLCRPTEIVELTRRTERFSEEIKELPPSGEHTTDAEPAPGRGIDRLISASSQMAAVHERILNYAPHDAPVLISGETGTGKELVAHALHEAGSKGDASLVAVNCAAMSDSLVASELFGHERGAFTGAQTAYRGLFREAGVGTVFLDEIGDISPALQTSLLRVLETSEVRPVGSGRRHKIACRIIAATNADLQQRVKQGSFRQDLFFRLMRLHLHVPPLRERPDDITPLVDLFLNEGRPPGQVATISPELAELLRRFDWPGNVRQLRNVIERMRVLNSDKLYYQAAEVEAALTPMMTFSQISEPRSRAATPSKGDSLNEDDGGENSAPSAAARESQLGNSRATPSRSTGLQTRDEIERYLGSARSDLRRLDRLREVCSRVGKLKTAEAARILGVSRQTAARDLGRLVEAGVIVKMTPTASRRSDYYLWRASDPDDERD